MIDDKDIKCSLVCKFHEVDWPLENRSEPTLEGGVREEKSEPWWSVTLAVYMTSMTDYSMRRILWDFGRTAVQPGGSHGVALLSHRRDSSSMPHTCAILTSVHPSCTCTRLLACMRARGERDKERGYVSHLARRTCYSSVRRNQKGNREQCRNSVLSSEK